MLARIRHLFGWLIGCPRPGSLDRLFWVTLRRLWSGWRKPLIVATPETVVCWHRAGFRWYWGMAFTGPEPGRTKTVSRELRDLIFRMVAENPIWSAPRIHGDLLMLGP